MKCSIYRCPEQEDESPCVSFSTAGTKEPRAQLIWPPFNLLTTGNQFSFLLAHSLNLGRLLWASVSPDRWRFFIIPHDGAGAQLRSFLYCGCHRMNQNKCHAQTTSLTAVHPKDFGLYWLPNIYKRGAEHCYLIAFIIQSRCLIFKQN